MNAHIYISIYEIFVMKVNQVTEDVGTWMGTKVKVYDGEKREISKLKNIIICKQKYIHEYVCM